VATNELLCDKNAGAWVLGLNGFIFKKINENKNKKERQRSWRQFGIYQLVSTANLALFEWNWAELAVLIGWWIVNGPQDLFQ